MIVIPASLRSDFIHMAGMTIHTALESTIHIVGIRICAICDELKLLKSSEDPEVRGFQSELVTRLSARSIGTGRPPTSGICSNLPQLS
jgi:hypothetical protein